jgi:hypothetical protein
VRNGSPGESKQAVEQNADSARPWMPKPFLDYDVEIRQMICSTDEIVKPGGAGGFAESGGPVPYTG